MSDDKIHAIILTKNEELHIARCINSLKGMCNSITLVDSGSTDQTVDIARGLGANVLFNNWVNYSVQMNFAIDSLAGLGGWILRLDADEVLDMESGDRLGEAIANSPLDIDGLLIQRRIYFLGRRIKHGGIEPSWQLRLFRNGRGRCEQRWMDEHILVAGKVAKSKLVLSDINLNSLSWWTEKHNIYASREAIDALNNSYNFANSENIHVKNKNLQAKIRRIMKNYVYYFSPNGVRSLFYFIYRYFFRFGVLDGREGFYFHALQGLWYRMLVDAKIREIEAFAKTQRVSIVDAIRARTGIDPLV